MRINITNTGMFALLGVLILTGCQKDVQQRNDYTGERISVTAQADENDATTRTTINGFRTEWIAGDKIGVFSSQAGASNLPHSAASAGATSTFNGNMVWGSGAHDFYAYYPHAEGTFTHTAVPVSLPASQTQSAGDDVAHVSALDFTVASPLTGIAPGGDVQFGFSHLFTLLEFRVVGTGSISKIELAAPASTCLAFEDGTVDISQTYPAAGVAYTIDYAGLSSSAVELTLASSAVLTEDDTTTPALYMMVNPAGLSGEQITVTATIDGEEKTITAEGFNFARGRKYVLVVDPDKGVTQPDPEEGVVINGVKWATRNVGEYDSFAASPESYGNLYLFNDIRGACPAGWRMPTEEEYLSLVSSGSVWTTVNNVNGRRFGSGDNTIFLPATGQANYYGNVTGQGTDGNYWSSTVHTTNNGDRVYFLGFNETIDSRNMISIGSAFGLRCVEGSVSVTGVEVLPTTVLKQGQTHTLTATVLPEAADNQNVTWESSNPAVATVNPTTGEVIAIGEGTTTITVTTEEGGFSNTGSLIVTPASVVGDISFIPDSVDPNSTLVEYTASTEQWQQLLSSDFGFVDDMVEITNTVYSKFNDDFDFIFYVLNMPKDETIIEAMGLWGVNISVSNGVQGLGRDTYSNSAQWGSAGKLKSVMYFPFDNAIVHGPSLHEFAHTWAAYIVPTYDWDNSRYDYDGHWGVSNAGGQLGGFKYIRTVEEDSGGVTGKTLYQASMSPDTEPDGSFSYGGFGTNVNNGNMIPFSDIELYLMGMKSADELRAENFKMESYSGISYSLEDQYSANDGYFWSTTKTSYTVDDLIEYAGARVPNAASSQKSFKILTVVLTQEGQTENNYAEIINGVLWFAGGMDDYRYGNHLYNFRQATYGQGTLVVDGVKNSLKPQTRSGVVRTVAPLATPALPDDYRSRIHIDRVDDKLLAPER